MPRVIDQIKKIHPKSTLIAYKLFDGEENELIKAAEHTCWDSKANLVFANHPAWAKTRKIAITQDGAAFNVTFEEHIQMIHNLVNEKFYKTQPTKKECEQVGEETEQTNYILDHYPRTQQSGRSFGTFAIRIKTNNNNSGFLTTTRGKRDKTITFVEKCEHDTNIVYAQSPATLNAPLLHLTLEKNPEINFLIHDHKNLGKTLQDKYQFPGTTGDLKNCPENKKEQFIVKLPHHGYLAGFKTFQECKDFIKIQNKN